MGKIKSIILTDSERLSLEAGFRNGSSHCFRMRCRAVLLKSTGLSSKYRFADGNVACVRQLLGKTFLGGRHQWPADPPRPGPQTYHGLYGRGSCPQSRRTGQAERPQSPGSLAESHGERSKRPDIQAFFISIGARYKRIRKRPRGVPSPKGSTLAATLCV